MIPFIAAHLSSKVIVNSKQYMKVLKVPIIYLGLTESCNSIYN